MKLKRMTRRIIAVLLSISMLLTVLPMNWNVAFAESGNSAETILASLSDEVSSIGEAKAEAYADSTADKKVQAGDWKTAIYVDRLAWNRFHIEVQKDIVAKYKLKAGTSATIKSEYSIEFVDKNGEKTGKTGRADISIKKDDETYLWEVKPYSYSVDPKKSSGEAQLKNYVFSANCTKTSDYIKAVLLIRLRQPILPVTHPSFRVAAVHFR